MTLLSTSTYWVVAAIAFGLGALWLYSKVHQWRERKEASRTAWKYLSQLTTATAVHKQRDRAPKVPSIDRQRRL